MTITFKKAGEAAISKVVRNAARPSAPGYVASKIGAAGSTGGSVTFKKAGKAGVTRVVQTAGAVEDTAAPRAEKAVTPTIELSEPRHVTKAEAHKIIPNKESTKETMMPWRGWVDRLLQDRMSPEQYQKWRETFYFWPEDPYNLHQMPAGTVKVQVSADGKQEAGIREVSPGEQDAVDVPLSDLADDPYDSGYFKKDTRRRFVDPEFPHPEIEKLKLDMQDQNDPEVQAAQEKLAAGPSSSPGNKNMFATGPSDFDPTGLRAVMAVTNAEMQKELDKHMPDHLPEPTWTKNEAELFEWYKERDLPVPIGGTLNFRRKEKRVARW